MTDRLSERRYQLWNHLETITLASQMLARNPELPESGRHLAELTSDAAKQLTAALVADWTETRHQQP